MEVIRNIIGNNKLYLGFVFLFTAFYLRGLFTIIYGIDASYYASISAEMIETNNWLQIFYKGNDYLDKPPLHFWLSALSFKAFGVNTFAYKFPSFLFTLLGTYSIYKLGKLLYNTEIGKISALFFYSCFSIILINQDVRTDTILIGIVVFAIWNLIAYIQTNNSINFLFGFVGIGLAMLVKGPIGLMVPVLALGIHFLVKREWSNIFKWQWLVGLGITALVISPMVWGLYTQFDLQPTKEFKLSSGISGKGTSGLQFYFWDQSFGRISGGNEEWKNDATPFFFTHTFLWSFLPWSIVGVFALFFKVFKSFAAVNKHEFYTLGAIILPFIAMSASQYKLPHYIYVFFPFWFILAGWYFYKVKVDSVSFNILKWIHHLLTFLSVLLSIFICVYIFPTSTWWIWIILLLLLVLVFYFYKSTSGKTRFIGSTLSGFAMMMFVFSFHFMPSVLQYDAPYNAAKKSIELNVNTIFSNNISSLAFDIYGNSKVELGDIYALHHLKDQNNYFFVFEDNLDWIKETYEVKAIHKFPYNATTQLRANFINPATREASLTYYYLVEF